MPLFKGKCFLCGKEKSEDYTLCHCASREFCDICKDQLSTCQDCAAEYCGECFHKPEHDLCSPRAYAEWKAQQEETEKKES